MGRGIRRRRLTPRVPKQQAPQPMPRPRRHQATQAQHRTPPSMPEQATQAKEKFSRQRRLSKKINSMTTPHPWVHQAAQPKDKLHRIKGRKVQNHCRHQHHQLAKELETGATQTRLRRSTKAQRQQRGQRGIRRRRSKTQVPRQQTQQRTPPSSPHQATQAKDKFSRQRQASKKIDSMITPHPWVHQAKPKDKLHGNRGQLHRRRILVPLGAQQA